MKQTLLGWCFFALIIQLPCLFSSVMGNNQVASRLEDQGQILSVKDLVVYAAGNPSEYENIIKMCERIEAMTPAHRGVVYKVKGQAYYRKWKLTMDSDAAEHAERNWSEAIKEMPEDIGSRSSLAILYFDLGKINDGLSLIEEIRTLEPNSRYLGVLREYSEIALREQRATGEQAADERISLYRAKYAHLCSVISNNPTSALYLEIGDVLSKLNEYGETQRMSDAIAAWHKAVDMGPTNITAMSRLMKTYIEQGDYESANRWVMRIASIDQQAALKHLAFSIKAKESIIQRLRKRSAEAENSAMQRALNGEVARLLSELDAIKKIEEALNKASGSDIHY